MIALAFFPISVPAATAARSISPVAKWHRQYSSFTSGACVPLPAPGGPVVCSAQIRSLARTWDALNSHCTQQSMPMALTYEDCALFLFFSAV
eukprot:16586-Heterococcus_DN1.PRE.3